MEPKPEQLFDLREYPVLCVDDEPENLRIFELAFRRKFTVLTAESADEGLEILNSSAVSVVLSDHKMPGTTGVEFLAKVRELDPKTIRILVTAYGDAETLSSAINSGSIYRYVPKPWTPEDMEVTVRRAIEVYALDREREALVRELGTVNRLAQTINQELSADRLVRLLVRLLTRDLSYDAASLLLLDGSGERLGFAGLEPQDGVADELSSLEIRENRAPRFFEKLRSHEPHILNAGEALDYEAPVRDWVTEVAADQILVVPLEGRSGLIGALAVDNRRGGSPFGVADDTLLRGVATQAAIALQNAWLVRDLRQSRQQVMRADRLGTLGTLAAGLAHEINNPLVSIHTFLSLASDKRSEDDAEFWGDYYRLACSEVDRIRGLVATMSRFGRIGDDRAPREPCDVAELAREVIAFGARESQADNVSVEVLPADDLPKIEAAREQLHQVLLNLLLNALHASPAGGRIEVRIAPDSRGGTDGIAIEVSDQGEGIAEEDLERIFDPFFTTKDPDQGTGLGLMMSHRIVSDHGGTVEVESRPGEGATFRVRLPVRAAPELAG